MGKRKRRDDPDITPPASDAMPYSSRTDSLSKERSHHAEDSSAQKPMSSIMDIMDSSVKLPNAHLPCSSPRHHNLNGAILLRHPCHFYGRKYSRRNSANNADTSTSRGKCDPSRDVKTSLKIASHNNSDDVKTSLKITSHNNSDCGHAAESKEQALPRPERIRSSFSVASRDVARMVCGICQKLLKRKPCILGTALSGSELSVVAVLVCGHVYHADCLEERTSHEHKQDPFCPTCQGLLSQFVS